MAALPRTFRRAAKGRAARRGLALVLVSVLLAGCGGGSGAQAPNEWAAAVCRQISSWEESVGSLATELQTLGHTGEDVGGVRAELVGFIDRMVERTDEMIAAVAEEGQPDAARGEAIAGGLREGLEKANRAFAEARTKAQDLPMAGASELEQGAEEVAGDLAAAGETLEQDLDTLGDRFDAPAVGAAIDNEPDCQQITTRGDAQVGAWADDVCSQIASWQQELQGLVRELQSSVEGLDPDPALARGRLVEFTAQVVASTDRLVQAAERAGAPTVPQGDAVAQDLQDGLRQVRQAFEEARANAENLAVDDPAAFTAGTQTIRDNVRQAVDRIAEELGNLDRTYDIPELDRAFAEAPACQRVSG